MENCTIYSHSLAFDKIEQIIKSTLPKSKIEINDGGIQKSLIATIKGGFFSKSKTLKINYRQRQNPSYNLDQIDCGLSQNLMGMVNYIQSLPANNVEVRNKFLIKVMSANCEMAFIATPEINDEFESILRKIVTELDGFIFAQPNSVFKTASGQHFVDKDLNLILDVNGNCDINDIDVKVDTKYHDQPSESYTKDQKDRKLKSESFLNQHNIKVNTNLPCSKAASDTTLRSVEEIIDRAYALLIIAVKGEGIEQEHLIKTVKSKNIKSFTSKETTIVQALELSDHDRAYATWRYESLYTLLWALGLMEELKYPSEICDVPAIVGKIFEPSREDFENGVKLLDKDTILSELDKTYRMHWACVDARIKGDQVTGNINPSVVYERHYSLNWLTCHENQDWDDIQTNT